MTPESMTALVHGRVQGVGFRYFVLHEARALGLTGFARNLADGSVEVYAEGARAALEDLRELLERGPGAARVKRVDVRFGAAQGEAADFRIR
jgi:acylphosphatase